MTDVVRRRLVVTGRVQGVFYRASCRQEAESLGLSGWVRNNPDGAVEAEVEGSRESVAALVAWAWFGPPQAQVDEVGVSELEPTDQSGFSVR